MFEPITPLEPVVFFVDDDVDAVRAASELVRSFGHEVRAFAAPQLLVEALESLDVRQTGCVIVDQRVPGVDGLELHHKIIERGLSLPTILLTGYADTSLTVRAMRGGVLAVLDKPCRDSELWSFIQEALSRSHDETIRLVHQRRLEVRFRHLAVPERHVLQLILEGCKNRTMARRLDVSLRTVENRRRRIFDVLEAESVAQLVRMVMEFEHGLPPTRAKDENWMALPYERVG